MRRSSPQSLSGALERLLSRLSPDSDLANAQQVWEAAVGPVIAAEARPIAERGGTLTVQCSGSVWAAELEMISGELLEKLNASLDRAHFERLRCVVR